MIWSIIEDLIAITIGSVPSLKPLFVRLKWISGIASQRRHGKKSGGYENGESYDMNSVNKSKNTTRVTATLVEESDSVKDLVGEEGIVVSSELRQEDEYEYHDVRI